MADIAGAAREGLLAMSVAAGERTVSRSAAAARARSAVLSR